MIATVSTVLLSFTAFSLRRAGVARA